MLNALLYLISRRSSSGSILGLAEVEQEQIIVCYVGGFVLFCFNQRNYVVIMNIEQCISIVNHIIKGEGELFTSNLILTDSRGARWSKWTPRAIFGCPVVF